MLERIRGCVQKPLQSTRWPGEIPLLFADSSDAGLEGTTRTLRNYQRWPTKPVVGLQYRREACLQSRGLSHPAPQTSLQDYARNAATIIDIRPKCWPVAPSRAAHSQTYERCLQERSLHSAPGRSRERRRCGVSAQTLMCERPREVREWR